MVISDYADSGVWDEIFKANKFDHVSDPNFLVRKNDLIRRYQIVHVAAPMVDDQRNTDYDQNFLRPAVEG